MHIGVQFHMGPSLGDVQRRSVGALGLCRSVAGFLVSCRARVSDSVNPLYTKHYSVARCVNGIDAELQNACTSKLL